MTEIEYCTTRKIRKVDIDEYEDISRIINAAGNKARIAILEIISEYEEVCTCELQPALGMPQPTITTHLSKMYDVGLLKKKQVWRFSYYYINPKYRELVNTILKDRKKEKETS